MGPVPPTLEMQRAWGKVTIVPQFQAPGGRKSGWEIQCTVP